MNIPDAPAPTPFRPEYLNRDEQVLITAKVGKDILTFIGLARDLMSDEYLVLAATRLGKR